MGPLAPSPGGGDLLPEGCNRVAQSVVLGLQNGDLVLQSAAHRLDLLLLLLNGLDHGRGQFAVGNAIGTIFIVLPFDQRKTVLGFGSLDGVVQRCRQGLFEILRDKAIALGLVGLAVCYL